MIEIPRIRSGRRRSAVAATLAAAVVLSLLAAAWLTPRIGASRIVIGLDLLSPPEADPVLAWSADCAEARDPIPMRRVDDEFARRLSFFEVRPTSRKDPRSRGYEIGFACDSARLAHIIDLPEGWSHHGERLQAKSGSPLRWVGVADTVELTLYQRPSNGIAEVTTAGGTERYDLYIPDGDSTIQVSVPPKTTLVRYTARVARNDVNRLRLVLSASSRLEIFRLYMASLVPVVAYPDGKPTFRSWGAPRDDWPQAAGDQPIPLPAISLWERGGWVTFAAVFVVTALALIGLGGAGWMAWRLGRWLLTTPETNRVLAPFRARLFLALFVPLAATWLLYLCAFWPGAMSNDSLNQWQQAETMDLDDWHPAFHTLTIKAITTVWHSPAAVALVQILLMSALGAWGYGLLLRAGVPRYAVILAWLTTLLSLRNGMMAIVLWKDVFYSIALFALALLLASRLLGSRRETGATASAAWAKTSWWIALGATLGVIPLYRHNGLIVLVGLLPALPLVFWPRRGMALAACGVALYLFVFVKKGLYPILHVKPQTMASQSVETKLAILHNQDVPFAQDDLERLRDAGALPEGWTFSPPASQPAAESAPAAAGGLDVAYSPALPLPGPDAKSVIFALALKHPLVLLRERLLTNSYLYWPPEAIGRRMATVQKTIERNRERLAMRPLLPQLQEYLDRRIDRTERPKWVWLFWRPALHLWAVAAALAILLWRVRDFRFLIVYLPVLLNTAGLFLIGPSPEQRYQFPLTFAAGFLVCLALLPRERSAGG